MFVWGYSISESLLASTGFNTVFYKGCHLVELDRISAILLYDTKEDKDIVLTPKFVLAFVKTLTGSDSSS